MEHECSNCREGYSEGCEYNPSNCWANSASWHQLKAQEDVILELVLFDGTCEYHFGQLTWEEIKYLLDFSGSKPEDRPKDVALFARVESFEEIPKERAHNGMYWLSWDKN